MDSAFDSSLPKPGRRSRSYSEVPYETYKEYFGRSPQMPAAPLFKYFGINKGLSRKTVKFHP